MSLRLEGLLPVPSSGNPGKLSVIPARLAAVLKVRYSRGMDRNEILHVLSAFEEEGLEYVLIGATAMGFHGIVRATEDLDLFIRATSQNVERLKRAFRKAYPGDATIDEISAEEGHGSASGSTGRRGSEAALRFGGGVA